MESAAAMAAMHSDGRPNGGNNTMHPLSEIEEAFASPRGHLRSASLRVPRDERIRDEEVLKMGTDGTWLPRRLVLNKTHLYFLRVDDDEEGVIDSIELVNVREVKKSSPSGLIAALQTNGRRTSSTTGMPALTRVPSLSQKQMKAMRRANLLKAQSESKKDVTLGATDTYAFEIQSMAGDAFEIGRDYYIRTQTKESQEEWVAITQQTVKNVKAELAKQVHRVVRMQHLLRYAYHSTAVQLVVVGLIIANFAILALQAEIRPSSSPDRDELFADIDLAFTILFCVEVLINLLGHWFMEFFKDGWNCFDFTIVALSVLQRAISDLPGLSHIRILRVFRVLRVFGRLENLRRIISSITASLLPVLQAFLIGLIVCFIYAIIGVEYFADTAPLSFATFSRAVYTLFGVVAFQKWTDDIAAFDDDNSINYGPVVYIYSYVIIVVWVLLQVVVAVLLENFFSATASDKEQTAKARAIEERAITSPLDPLLQIISSQFDTSVDLSNRIRTLFEALDMDKEGFLTFSSLRHGLAHLHLHTKIALSQDDYNAMVDVPGL